MRFLSVNDFSFLIELADLEQTLALFDALQNNMPQGITEIIPAARTLLIAFDQFSTNEANLQNIISSIKPDKRSKINETLIEIPVVYNGEDLDDVANLLNLDREEIIRRHTQSQYSVAFTGFAPGFAYLTGGDPIFDVPRRASPRKVIPAGSVALAGKFSGVYPQASPGGWQLIGQTDIAMFDLDRDPPSLLKPGDKVRFVDVTSKGTHKQVKLPSCNEASNQKQIDKNVLVEDRGGVSRQPSLEIISTLMPITFQDKGRVGQTSQGLSPSGALDQGSMCNANYLVGNKLDMPVLEITYGNAVISALEPSVIAFCGADQPITITTNGGETLRVTKNCPIAIDEGDTITVGAASSGFRSYMALRGGFAVQKILLSASRDTLSNIGPEPLSNGALLYGAKDKNEALYTPVSLTVTQAFPMPKPGETVVLDVVMGPRTDWFTTESVELFFNQLWQVTAEASRVGMRLLGDQPLQRAIKDELPSEGTATGAIQIPMSGQPVLFLRDRPVTGGYPVIANLAHYHIDLAAQIPIGCKVRFQPVKQFSDKKSASSH